ncbi:hypothetical protein U9M48_019293 [Paspalum notatum var. saurae]|uniref:Uncharacterized protein n=1 Tax=Paspalum notatum var. saurae TaxID=547442 RepID=A0AAQ3WRE2_PASNO
MAVGEILHGSSCQATNSPGASFLLGVLSCPSVAAPLLSKQQQHQRTTCSTKFRNGLAPLLSMQDTATGHHGFALLIAAAPPRGVFSSTELPRCSTNARGNAQRETIDSKQNRKP